MNPLRKNETATAASENENLVPLNGKMLPRLINMRIERANQCSCDRCTDLLSVFHKNRARLNHEHQGEQWALRFWTDTLPVRGLNDPYAINVREHAQSVLEVALLEEIVDSLTAAEKKWQQGQSESCLDDDTDENWLRHYMIIKQQAKETREKQRTVVS
jgi:hypothetical protein